MSRCLHSLRLRLSVWALALAMMPMLASAGTGVYGKVVGATSQAPIAGAHVLCAQLDTSVTVVRTQLTGSLGGFEFNTLAAGRWLVVVSANGYQTAYQGCVVAAGAMKSMQFALKTQAEAQGGVIEGSVTNRATGAPIPCATVYYQLQPTSGTAVIALIQHVMTDANGHYRIAGLHPGAYALTACAAGFASAHRTVEVAAGAVAIANFGLEPAVTPLPGAIVGRVIDAKTSEPLVGARVYYGPLYSATAEYRWFDTDGSPLRPYVVTDSTGRFKIESLAPGLYYLLATKDGYGRQQMQVTVVSGQTREVRFKLAPLATTGNIKGLVTTTAGLPIAGATVYYQPHGIVYFQQPRVLTGSDGRYTIPPIPTGECRVWVLAEGFYSQSRMTVVVAGATVELNFRLMPKTASVGTVTGRVIDAKTSAPLIGAKIRIVPTVQNSTAPICLEGLTYTNGEYKILNVPAGGVLVTACQAGYLTQSRTATVPAAGTVAVNFRLTPIDSIKTGKVVGQVLDAANEKPIAGAVVRLIPADAIIFDLMRSAGLPRETLTDANGQYGFERVPAGSYQVVAGRTGYKQLSKPAQVVADSTTEVNFLLEAVPAIEYGKLYGRVVDAVTSTPIAAAWVAIQMDVTDPLAATPTCMKAYTNASGYFSIERVPVGTGTVYAAKKGYMPASQAVEITKGQTAIVGFGLQPVTSKGVIEGNVTDTSTGLALAGINVIVPLLDQPHMANANTAYRAVTNTAGHYRIEGVPAGPRKAVAFSREYVPGYGMVTVVAGQTAQLDFALTRRTSDTLQTVTVKVVNAAGAALPGVRLSVPVCDVVEPFTEWDLFQTATSGAGTATLGGVPTELFFAVGALANYQPAFVLLPDKYEAVGGVSSMTMTMSPLSGGNSATDWASYQ